MGIYAAIYSASQASYRPMKQLMRTSLAASLFLLALISTSLDVSAQEHIYVSGGPALRFHERYKKNTHDRFWGNFIQSALARYRKAKPAKESGEFFTWLVFKPAYVSRGKEEGRDLVALTEKMIKPTGAKLIWFEKRDELVEYLNKGQDRKKVKIKRFEYFGHSNKRNFMFDYSNRVNGGALEPLVLHHRHLRQIRRDIFAKDAYCRSWGCHSGEEYSRVWRRRFRVPMKGAVGKTDYSSGGVPVISTPKGKWVQ